MSELAAAGVAAHFLGAGAIDVGKEIKVYMVDVLTRSLDKFDYEKVFVEGIVSTVIFATLKIVYWIYSQSWLISYTIAHPNESSSIIGFLTNMLMGNWTGAISAIFNTLKNDPAVAEEEKEALEVERKKDFFLYYGKPFFEDYWVWVILGIWGIFILMEKRRVDVEHRKRRLLMRLASQ